MGSEIIKMAKLFLHYINDELLEASRVWGIYMKALMSFHQKMSSKEPHTNIHFAVEIVCGVQYIT